MQKKAPETTQPVPVEVDFGAYRVGDPEEFGRNMLKLMEEGSKLLSDLLGRSNGNGGPYSMASETSEFGEDMASDDEDAERGAEESDAGMPSVAGDEDEEIESGPVAEGSRATETAG